MNEWLDMLRASRSFATRLLPPLATTEAGVAKDPELARFLTGLSTQDRRLAVDGLDLMAADYLEFLERRLPKLLAELRTLRADELTEVGPALSGQPAWGATVLGWTSGSLAADRFVSRVTVKTMALPENMALRLLLKHLAVLAGAIGARLRDRTHRKILQIAALTGSALRDPAVRAIPDAAGPSEHMLVAAEGASDPAYREVGRLLRRRLLLSQIDDLSRWRRTAYAAALGATELTPIDPEEVFELLALSSVLDALEHDLHLGPPRSYWLRIGANARSGPIVEFSDGDGGTVEIYFDRTPAFLLRARTPYTEIFHRHEGLGRGADRRPDIVFVRHGRDNRRAVFFLEVKLPGGDGTGHYVRDSIYKAFGYLYDFAGLWDGPQAPKVGLYVPSDAGPKHTDGDAYGDVVILSPRRPGDLPKAIGAALELSLTPPDASKAVPPSSGGVPLLV